MGQLESDYKLSMSCVYINQHNIQMAHTIGIISDEQKLRIKLWV